MITSTWKLFFDLIIALNILWMDFLIWKNNNQASDLGIFKKTEFDIESPAGPTIAGADRKNLVFLYPLGCWKMHFLKSGKYSVTNKSTTSAIFCNPYLKSLHFTSLLYEFQQWKFWNFFQKNRNSCKNLKNHMSEQNFVLRIFRFLCFWWIHNSQNLWRHRRHWCTLFL